MNCVSYLTVFTHVFLPVLVLIACADPADKVVAAKVSSRSQNSTQVKTEARLPKPKPNAEVRPVVPSVKNKTEVDNTPDPYTRKLKGEIVFIGSKVTGSHECLFETWTGTAHIPDNDLRKASFKFSVDTASVVVDYKNPGLMSKKLASHLKSHDFFHSKASPKAEFVSESVTQGGMNGQGTHVVTGQMTIRNTKRQISFPATMSLNNGRFKAEAEFSIRRKRFNIIYPGKPDDLIRDRVVLKLKFEG